MSREQIAKRLMEMAARRSVQTQFRWARPRCQTLEEGARLLRNEPVQQESVGAVLSGTAYVTPEH